MIQKMLGIGGNTGGSIISADKVSFDPTATDLEATDVQAAIEEVNTHATVEYPMTLPSGYVWFNAEIEEAAILRIVRVGNLRINQPCLIALNPNNGTQFNYDGTYVELGTIESIDRPSESLWANVWTFQNHKTSIAVDPCFVDYRIEPSGIVRVRARQNDKNLAWIPSFVWTVD